MYPSIPILFSVYCERLSVPAVAIPEGNLIHLIVSAFVTHFYFLRPEPARWELTHFGVKFLGARYYKATSKYTSSLPSSIIQTVPD